MTKTEKAIELIKENPFRRVEDIAEEAGLKKRSLISALSDRDINLSDMREEAVKQMFKALPDDFKFDWSEFSYK
jgi:AcrR family transcriptional regulator